MAFAFGVTKKPRRSLASELEAVRELVVVTSITAPPKRFSQQQRTLESAGVEELVLAGKRIVLGRISESQREPCRPLERAFEKAPDRGDGNGPTQIDDVLSTGRRRDRFQNLLDTWPEGDLTGLRQRRAAEMRPEVISECACISLARCRR